MKIYLAMLFFLTLTSAAQAGGPPPAGRNVQHEFDCPGHAGTTYSIHYETKALAPDANIVGCQLISQRPDRANPDTTELVQLSQDIKQASFQTPNAFIKVAIDKASGIPTLTQAGGNPIACDENDAD